MKSLFIMAMFFISFSLGGLVCDSCEASVQVVYNQLNSTDTKILEDVEQLCYVAPPLYYHLCLAVVDRVYHNLVTYFENKITPEDVCIELGLCKADDTIEPTNPTFKEQCQIQEIITNDDYNSLLYFPSICKQVFNDESCENMMVILKYIENDLSCDNFN